ncbi:hypothetical protein O3M35_005211 [Rhynocoris fuscipes]|uniref:Uncharacterized protein n=1 Tax=Rhynocoris fuscipes TaxID=488301 RepID=A0AAW1DPY9_9HEMI
MAELERKMCFMHQVKCQAWLADCAQKLIKSKLDNIRMEYKKFLSWLKLFLRYDVHKIRNFELFCWQHCWFDSLEILI